MHGFDFGAQENGVTFGRHVISTGADHFPTQNAATLGNSNAYPKVGPIVISEINYHPVDVFVDGIAYNDSNNEYIELHNTSSAAVRLYDQARPTNTWHLNDAVEFTFPQNTSIPAGGYLVVVSFSPMNLQKLAAFTNANPVAAGTPILGPWQGALDNAGEGVELRRPGRPEANGVVPSILVERIRYDNMSPWPAAADGFGPALQRVSVTGYGNDPTNWIATGRSPGGPYGDDTPPAITSNPNDLTVVAGEAAQFTIGASGTPPLSYQWRRNGQPISGGTSPTLTLPNVQTYQAGTYDCIALNASGSMQSSGAVLTVLVPVEITLQPTDFIVPANSSSTNYGKTRSNIVFRIVARSEYPPVQYQWRKNGQALPGANTADFAINDVDLSHEGSYDVVVTDVVSQRTSRLARLIVSIRPFFTEPHVLSHTVPVGAQVNLVQGVKGNPLPLSNYWRKASSFILTNMVSNFVGTLTLSNVQLSDAATYNVIGGNALGTNTPSISRFAYLTMVDPHRDQVVSIGANVTNRVDVRSSVSSSMRYQWFKDGNVIPSATTTSFVVTNFQSGDAGIYTLAVTNYAVTNQGYSTPLVAFFDALLSTPESDIDGDGMPNWFEDQYNFVNGINDAGDDSDGDRISNINEYRSGTDPRDAQSFLRIEISNVAGVLLQFMAISNRSYSILYRQVVDGPLWQHLQSFAMVATNRLETCVDPVGASERYYRLVTPRQP